jgi:glucose dehydrogenase
VRGSVTAYDIKDGKQVWRGYSDGPDERSLIDPEKTTDSASRSARTPALKTWQGDQWKIGGGTTWGWYSYDPEAEPDVLRLGQSLDLESEAAARATTSWSMTIFARDVDTGMAKWVYQMTPHDEWDYDGVNEMILSDSRSAASRKAADSLRPQRLRLHARSRHRRIAGGREVRSEGQLDHRRRHEQELADLWPSARSSISIRPNKQGEDVNTKGICPAALGTKDEQPAAYSPDTQLFYVPTNHVCMDYEPFKVSYTAGQPYVGATLSMYPPPASTHMGNFIAWDARPARSSGRTRSSSRCGRARSRPPAAWCSTERSKATSRRSMPRRARNSTSSRPRPASSATSRPTSKAASSTSRCCPASAAGPASAWQAGLTDPTAGLGAVGGYAALSNYTALGGTLTVFALPQ